MQLHVISVDEISVPKNRQRKFFDEDQIQELAASIADNGLIHPLVIRREEGGELSLVAGERRLRALDIVWGYGQEVRCGTKVIPERCVPCLYLGEIDGVAAFEIELEENIRRTDLDWKEKAVAVSRLYELRRLQSERDGKPLPTPATISEEISGTAEGQHQENVRQDLILARNLDNPAVSSANSRKEAFKALKRSEEIKRNEQLGRQVGLTFSRESHSLRNGDALSELPNLPDASFDVILTDPPYGIDAQEFGDSGGKTAGPHRYDDSYETWQRLMAALATESFRVAKPEAHAYIFCDIDRFIELRNLLGSAGWRTFRTPLVWFNPGAIRAPWPEHGPQRKYQIILYAIKGNRQCTRLYGDVLSYPSDPNLGHQAQKPVALLGDLLRRSVRPGDTVLDPFCGSGSIFPACHELKCKATGFELDTGAYGIAAKRLRDLK